MDMKPTILLGCALLLLAALGWQELSRRGHRRPTSSVAGSCSACHEAVNQAGPTAHAIGAVGCAHCHLGNPYAFEKNRAHVGLVLNPGELGVVDATCGQAGCHPEIAARVRNSIMATNSGILASLYRLWDCSGPASVAEMLGSERRASPAEDYFAKMCSACHLWWPRGKGLGQQRRRGGGCSACHVHGQTEPRDEAWRRVRHAALTVRVPMDNCLRCHNRSARVGLSYQGRFEDDGYGTPHQAGGPSRRRLSGGRFYVNLPPDVHFEAGMVCIDCHNGLELMGDGQRHATLRGQLDIACADCHRPEFRDEPALAAEARRLAELNDLLPPPEPERVAATSKGAPLYALRPVRPPGPANATGLAVLYRKLDGVALEFEYTAIPRPHHALPGHERLACQACHSRTVPQCYGCHVALEVEGSQTDKLLGRQTPGRWREYRSYTRFASPALALDSPQTRDTPGSQNMTERVMPFSPCQVFVSVLDAEGNRLVASPAEAAMAPMDPHATSTRSRGCLECHLDPKTLGLGQGRLLAGTAVRSTYDSAASGFGAAAAPEQFVNAAGEALQTFPTPGARPFNQKELQAILQVGPCLPCHASYEDRIYANFQDSLRRVRRGLAPGCDMPGTGPAIRASRQAGENCSW